MRLMRQLLVYSSAVAVLSAYTATAIPGNATAADRKTSWVEFAWFQYDGTETPTAEIGGDEFLNPILAGFYPDPSICRVGDEYFLINSTFAWFPGIPIFRSRDLVHWTQVGHVLDRPSQLNLDGRGVSEGVFAPAIEHRDGVFYVINTLVGAGGNFYVTADNPAGPWSDPKWLREVNGIDPSFFFDDDGRAYIVHNGPPPDGKPLYDGHRALWLHEFDFKTGTTRSGSARIIVNGGTDLSKKPVWIEGPHIFKREGFYYLTAAEGGTGPEHSQVVFRSRDVWGPYETRGKPILTQRHLPPSRPNPITCVGHADFVRTPADEWWAVFLGCRPYENNKTNIGRETFLLPVSWEDDWPIILDGDAAVPRVLKRPALPPQPPSPIPHHGSFTWRDDFDSRSLSLVWNFLRTPQETWYSLSDKPGSLLIAPRPVDLSSKQNPSLIARRQQHANFTASTSVALGAAKPIGAGLAAFQNETHYFFLGVRVAQDGHREIFLERYAGKQTPGAAEIIARANLPRQPEPVELKIDGAGGKYSFSYKLSPGEWTTLKENVDGRILSSDVAGGFVGTYLGMFARSSK